MSLLFSGGQPPLGAGTEYPPLGTAVCLGEAAGRVYMDHHHNMKIVVLLFCFLERKEESLLSGEIQYMEITNSNSVARECNNSSASCLALRFHNF